MKLWVKNLRINRQAGVAGQLALRASYALFGEDDDGQRWSNELCRVVFVGRYGTPGPVVMITGSGQTFVTKPERFGQVFNRQWVENFIMEGKE